MSSFISAVIRLLVRREPRESHVGDEHAESVAARTNAESAVMASTLGGGSHVPVPDRTPKPRLPTDDPLTSFRLLLGIESWPYLGFTISSPLRTRPAPNIGLYARVVHSEQKAKDSFKVFSFVINACYFLQIVVAAALTALGAARASSGAVTAFGAINTVIAGFLTFLKGSGLPGRFKYYGDEWRKIREYIEQRERDFMRPENNLNVYNVVETIEKMYNNLKQDIELNTPDSYTSLSNQRRVGDTSDSKVGGIDISKLESLASKLGGMGGGVEGLTAGLTKKAHGVTQSLHEHEKQIENEFQNFKEDVVKDVQGHKARLDREARQQEARAREAIENQKRVARDGIEDNKAKLDSAASEQQARALQSIHETEGAAHEGIENATSHAIGSISHLVKEIADIHKTAVESGRSAATQQIRRLAERLGSHDDKNEELKHSPGKSTQ
ncbi:hypothetical protein F5Y19DRAFT_420312 [Xylariaceae sp. FL1651]|nr:hypothetical protein F5Y19DRAFT_420312 [Xylariaceae sp. FL1651]